MTRARFAGGRRGPPERKGCAPHAPPPPTPASRRGGDTGRSRRAAAGRGPPSLLSLVGGAWNVNRAARDARGVFPSAWAACGPFALTCRSRTVVLNVCYVLFKKKQSMRETFDDSHLGFRAGPPPPKAKRKTWPLRTRRCVYCAFSVVGLFTPLTSKRWETVGKL